MSPRDYSWKPSKDDNGFLRFDLPRRWDSNSGTSNYWNFHEGEIRESIKEIYNKDSNYVLLNVVSNPEVDKLLGKYVGKFEWVKNGKEGLSGYRKAKKREKEYSLSFDMSFMEEYLSVLGNLADSSIGNKNYTSFPIVKGSTHEVWGSTYWPFVFILKDGENSLNKFKNIVGKLNDDEAYNLLKKREHPQNYNLGKINLLRDKKVLPLIVQPEEWRIDGENLKNAINFLVPFDLEYESHGNSSDGDL